MQPKEEPFHARNKDIQAELQQSTAASRATTTWWRIDNGRITVNNPQTGQQLWKEAEGPIAWEDWEVKRFAPAPDGTKRVEEVELSAIVARRRIGDLALLGAVVSVLAYYAPSVWPSIYIDVVAGLRAYI